jgi:hypothetical protein
MKKNLRIVIILIGLLLITSCRSSAEVKPSAESTTSHPSSTVLSLATPTLQPTDTQSPSATATLDLTARADIANQKLTDAINTALADHAGDWFIQVRTLDGQVIYSHQEDSPIYVDTMIHVPIAILFLKSLEINHITEIKKYITNMRDYETSQRQTLLEMIASGSQPAAKNLLNTIPKYNLVISQALQDWNVTNTNVVNATSTVQELNSWIGGLYSREMLTDESSVLVLDMLNLADLKNDPLRDLAPNGTIIYNKRVEISGESSLLGELAVIDTGQVTYLVCIFGQSSPTAPAGYLDLVQAYRAVSQVFWEEIKLR